MQSAQEDRRLIYVAMTRAVYHCLLCSRSKPGELKPFLEAALEHPGNWIETEDYTPVEPIKRLKKAQKKAFAETGTFESRNPSGVPPMPLRLVCGKFQFFGTEPATRFGRGPYRGCVFSCHRSKGGCRCC